MVVSPAEAGSRFLYSTYPGLTPWANFASAASRLVSPVFEEISSSPKLSCQ